MPSSIAIQHRSLSNKRSLVGLDWLVLGPSVLLYSTEACRILVRDKRSLEFTVTRSLMKLFRTSSANIVQD